MALCLFCPGGFLSSQNFDSKQEFTVLHHSQHVSPLKIIVDKKETIVVNESIVSAKGRIKAHESFTAFCQIRVNQIFGELISSSLLLGLCR